MTISATILKDSKLVTGVRVTTWQLTYPRFIHSEFMTHRVFSRNAASSRAIPFKTMIKNIKKDMARPESWGANQAGMQAKVDLKGFKLFLAQTAWTLSGHAAIAMAQILNATGVHKQIVNRVIEPFSHITVIMTTTDLDNFFELRAHPDAQPEFQVLAYQMKKLYDESTPEKLAERQWHLPFVDGRTFVDIIDYVKANVRGSNEWLNTVSIFDDRIQKYAWMISAARCARVSYLTHDGKRSSVETDIKLFDRLVGSRPLHASPIEHQVVADTLASGLHGNFSPGCIQLRKLYENNFAS